MKYSVFFSKKHAPLKALRRNRICMYEKTYQSGTKLGTLRTAECKRNIAVQAEINIECCRLKVSWAESENSLHPYSPHAQFYTVLSVFD